MQEKTPSPFLQGQIIALAYALDSCLRHMPQSSETRQHVVQTLDELSAAMLSRGNNDLADGVERIRFALAASKGGGH